MNIQKSAMLSLCCMATVLAGLFIVALHRHNSKISVYKTMPEFELMTINGESLQSGFLLNSNKRTVIMFFHPGCGFCCKEIEGIVSRFDECRNVQWLFVTISPQEELEPFIHEYHMEAIPYSYIICEDFPEMHIKYDVSSPPALFIYDENGNLTGTHKGAISIEKIVSELQ